MKKVLTACGFLISSSAMATGFYAGGQLGVNSVKIDNSYTLSITNPHAFTDKSKDSIGATGISYGIYGGYRFDFNNFFVASELDYNANTALAKYTVLLAAMAISQAPSLGFHFLAGLPIGKSSEVYGRIGYTETTFKNNLKTDHSFCSSGKSKGTILGVGAQHHLGDNISIRFDYKYTMYQAMTAANSGPNTTAEFSVKPESHSFTVGAQYAF
ncbi:MAG: outer membrane beta-barrel protein [Candidatus Endonucleobacter sp. (ex Gigantidas childressi)]|nr:outer membrane beta-barrel protein [Candidatus Endonucleobacter sp. (ex Gigantidas childressi)]